MGSLDYNIGQLDNQNNALPKDIQKACAEILTAAEKAGFHVAAVSWYNPDSTPEHHVPGFAGQGGVACDFMVYGNRSVQDFIDAYAWKNRDRLGICWQISRQRIRSTSPGKSGQWEHYSGAGHYDHTHMNFGRLAGTNGYNKVANLAYVPPAGPDPTGDYPVPSTRVVYLDKLRPGVTNSDSVYWVQRHLREIGITRAIKTGAYDTDTVAAVKEFQLSLGDAPANCDGVLGPLQTAALFDRHPDLGVTIEQHS